MIITLGAVSVSGQEPEPVRIGVLRGPTAVAFGPLIEDSSVLADGRTVEIVVFPSPSAMIPRLIDGDLDGATLPANVAAQLYNRGIDLEVAATFIWGVLYLIGPDEATGLDHLIGTRVHSPGRGATPDLILRFLLEHAGLKDRIEVAYGFAQVELSQLLIAGRVAAAVLPEPFVTLVLRQNTSLHVVADLQSEWEAATGSGLPQTVLVLDSEAGVSSELTRLLAESVEEIHSDPEAAAGTVERLQIGLDAQTAIDAIPRLNLRVESAAASRDALITYFEILHEFDPGSVGGSVPSDPFFGDAR